jgi:uncharacterized protein DUF4360
MRVWLALISLLLATSPGIAQDDVRFGKPGHGGPGCPASSPSVALSRQSLTVRFDRYEVAGGGSSRRSFDRKSCNLAIPFSVPAHRSVAVVGIEYRGHSRLPPGAEGLINGEYFVAGRHVPGRTHAFVGPQQGPFTLTSRLAASSIVWSACGATGNLRANTSLRLHAGGKASLELNTLVVGFKSRRC